MIDTVIRCDGPNCTSVRGAANHWLMARSYYNGGWIVFPWEDDAYTDRGEIKHLCGAQCAHSLLDKYLDEIYRREAA